MAKRKTLVSLRWEARNRDAKAFELAFERFTELFGLESYKANERAVNVLALMGYDVSDQRVKAIAALAVRAVVDDKFYKALKDGNVSYPSELEIPFK